jgi:hypothetical protein
MLAISCCPISWCLVFITPMPPITSAACWLVLSCSYVQVQSLAHTHVGSSPVVAPFFCPSSWLYFILFPSPVIGPCVFSPLGSASCLCPPPFDSAFRSRC